ncbi:hypothetical protein AB1Y20_013935 [Prymnesium parvum]|uniref:Hexosyltransferase n=1 Tax=Prymnesium parvum TaxID=97485 RepID=A0AB34IH68_PRYPA
MSVVRSAIPMRSSQIQSSARPERGDLSYVTVLAPKADPEAFGPDDDAAHGVVALHHSLRQVAAAHPLLCLCVLVPNATRARLASRGVLVREAAPIEGGRWGGSFIALHVLKLLEYRRLVYLDVDTIVLKNIDHLFALRQCDFAFAPDIGVDVSAARLYRINAGVFVHSPHHTILASIMQHKEDFTFDAEGGFLQAFINENRDRLDERIAICDLDVVYNAKRQLYLSHPSVWNCMRSYIHIVQFGGRQKPWHVRSTLLPPPPPPAAHEPRAAAPKPRGEGRGGAKEARRPPPAVPPPASHSPWRRRRRLEEAKAEHRAAVAPAKPPSSDLLFALWWAIYEGRRLPQPVELPAAPVKAAPRGAHSSQRLEFDLNRSTGEECVKAFLGAKSLAFSDADWRQLPYIGAALAVAGMWTYILIYASCVFNVSRRRTRAIQTDHDDAQYLEVDSQRCMEPDTASMRESEEQPTEAYFSSEGSARALRESYFPTYSNKQR